MSVKRKLFAAAASLTLVGGAGVAGLAAAGTANAATSECGIQCWDIFSPEFGHHNSPNFVVDSYKQGQAPGTPIILFQVSNSDPAEDFTVGTPDLVSDYWQAGLVSPDVALHYGCEDGVDFANCSKTSAYGGGTGGVGVDDYAFEIQYAPYGAGTGNCVGVAATATSGEHVALEPCGVSGKTLWILDTLDAPWIDFHTGYFPLINGSDTNFSQPFVLTYPSNGYPTNIPRPQLEVTNLSGTVINPFSPVVQDVNSNQLWGADFGQLVP
jgi:hypothetical protein